MNTRQLERMPGLMGLYARALLKSRPRKLQDRDSLPDIRIELNGVWPELDRLAAFRDVCGYDQNLETPLTYPFILMFPLQVALLTRPEFPFALPGLVHLGIRIQRARPGLGGPLALGCHMVAAERTDRGVEFDLVLEIREAGAVVWMAESRVLARAPGPRPRKQRPDAPQEGDGMRETGVIGATLPAARRYARLSGDWNPIHLGWAGARMFGFRRPIAHGMWTLARVLAETGLEDGRAPLGLEARFRAPFYLPGEALTRTDGTRFELRDRANDRLLVDGRVATGAQ